MSFKFLLYNKSSFFHSQKMGFTTFTVPSYKLKVPETLGKFSMEPQRVDKKKFNLIPRKQMEQQTPMHDFLIYKQMHGNEILLNLDQYENLRNKEIIAGLLELSN